MEKPDTQSPPATVKKSCAPGMVWALFGGLTLMMIAGFCCFYFFISKAASTPVDRLADALSTIFGAEVTVEGSTAVLEKSEIGELALVQRKTQAITRFETIWMGSKKLLIVRGDFVVKAGFDLSEGGHWGLLNGEINGPVPEAKVLSVEPLGELEIYYSESGVINKLSPEDTKSAFNHLIRQARRDAERSDITKEAERVLLRRINDHMNATPAEPIEWQQHIP